MLHALSDPVRLRIVAGLARSDDRTCGSFELPVTKSTCTHHFRVLREAGIIRQRAAGTARLNTLRREELDARFPGCSRRSSTPPADPPVRPCSAGGPCRAGRCGW